MRIDAYNQVNQIYQAQNIKKAQKAYQTDSVNTGYDQVQISQTGQDYQIAKQAVAGTSDIREDKVAEIKERMAKGTYSVDTEDFAKKLLERYNAVI